MSIMIMNVHGRKWHRAMFTYPITKLSSHISSSCEHQWHIPIVLYINLDAYKKVDNTHINQGKCVQPGGSGLPLQRPSSKQNVFSQSSHSNCISYFSKALTHYEKTLGSMTSPGRDNSGAIDSIKNEHLHQHMYGSCCEFSSGHELSDIVYALQQLCSRNWTLSSMAESERSYQGGTSR